MRGFDSLESWLCRWDHVNDFWCKFYLRYDLTIVPSPSHQLAFFIFCFFRGLAWVPHCCLGVVRFLVLGKIADVPPEAKSCVLVMISTRWQREQWPCLLQARGHWEHRVDGKNSFLVWRNLGWDFMGVSPMGPPLRGELLPVIQGCLFLGNQP